MYDALVFPTPEGSVKPWLATEWAVAADNLTYTFQLRRGVKFHDGSELTAHDVVFSLNRLLTVGQGVAYMFVDRIESVQALDDYTVEFRLREPYALFLLSLVRLYVVNQDLVMANIQRPGLYGEFGDYGTGWLLTNSAGSGPYRVREVRLEEFVLLERNKDWWAKDQFVANAPDEVRVIPLPDAATLRTLMANRELEISDQWQSADTFRALDEIAGVDIAAFDAATVLHLYLNTSRPPLDCVYVRRAMAFAFDYKTAASIDWIGTPVSRGPVPMSVAGFNPNLTPYVRDVARARQELARSRYARNIGDHPITFNWTAEVPDLEKYALLLQSNLAELGMVVTITRTPWLTITELVTTPKTTPHILSIYLNADLPEAGTMLFQRYHSSTVGTFYQGEWLRDEVFDRKIEQALATMDRERRFQLYHELQAYIMELSPSIFAFDQLQKHAYQTYIDWPAAKGEVIYPVMGYNQYFPFIGVNPPQ
jgi:peptide/nickel transport system substrate-binding protein